MTIRVLALSTLPTIGPSNRLRIEQYIPHLRKFGVELEVVAFIDDAAYRILYQPGQTAAKVAAVLRGVVPRARDLWRARDYELLLVHRESLPIGPPLIEALWGRRSRPYVFDFDDTIFLGGMHPANRRFSWLRHRPSRVARAVRGAAAVVAGNEYLASWARRFNADVTTLPTPVDIARHLPRPAHTQREPFVVGWTGSSTSAQFLRILDEPLARLSERREVVLRVVGGTYAHRTVQVDERAFRIPDEPADVASFDVGVLPEFDDPWTRGKGAFKALVYMATAIPVVASRVGVNTEVVQEGVTGYCVDGPKDWLDRLELLAESPSLRQRLGDAGRKRIEERYSLEVLAPRLAEVLHRAAGHP